MQQQKKQESFDGIIYLQSLIEQIENTENTNPVTYFYNDDSEMELTRGILPTSSLNLMNSVKNTKMPSSINSHSPLNSPKGLSKSELKAGFHNILDYNPRLQLLVDSWSEIHEEFVAVRDRETRMVNWGAAGDTDTGYFGEPDYC